jgi:hypothetical protein
MINTSNIPLNPHYGGGAFRRRIRLESEPGIVRAALEDDYHGFRLNLHHNGRTITDVSAESLRIPGSTCLEAPALLEAFVGKDLTADRVRFRGYAVPLTHCTHLHDLLWLACAQALRPGQSREYDMVVPDLRDERSIAEIRLDGELLHSWTIDSQQMFEPAVHRGQPLQQGFARWVSQAFSGDALEATFVLQMAILVGRARRNDVEALRRDFPVSANLAPAVCHSFQPEVVVRYVPRLNGTRDFSNRPDDLLKFL